MNLDFKLYYGENVLNHLWCTELDSGGDPSPTATFYTYSKDSLSKDESLIQVLLDSAEDKMVESGILKERRVVCDSSLPKELETLKNLNKKPEDNMKKYKLKESMHQFFGKNVWEYEMDYPQWCEQFNISMKALEEVDPRTELEFMCNNDGSIGRRWISLKDCCEDFKGSQVDLMEKAINGELYTKEDVMHTILWALEAEATIEETERELMRLTKSKQS